MQATLWMLGALLSFSSMAIAGRELSDDVPVFLMLLIRSLIGLIIICSIITWQRQFELFNTRRLKLHTVRNVFHFGGQLGWFIGIGLLPLGEVFALEFTVPFWTVLLATFILKDKLTSRKIIAVSMGMAGVLFVVRPGIEILDSAALIVLAAAFGYAASHTATKVLSDTEAPLTILFYMCLIQLPIGLVLSWNNLSLPDSAHYPWLILIGTTALTAHFCMTKALQQTDVTTVVTLDFLRLPLIVVIGMLFYAEPFDIWVIVGGALMLAGNIFNQKRAT